MRKIDVLRSCVAHILSTESQIGAFRLYVRADFPEHFRLVFHHVGARHFVIVRRIPAYLTSASELVEKYSVDAERNRAVYIAFENALPFVGAVACSRKSFVPQHPKPRAVATERIAFDVRQPAWGLHADFFAATALIIASGNVDKLPVEIEQNFPASRLVFLDVFAQNGVAALLRFGRIVAVCPKNRTDLQGVD